MANLECDLAGAAARRHPEGISTTLDRWAFSFSVPWLSGCTRLSLQKQFVVVFCYFKNLSKTTKQMFQ